VLYLNYEIPPEIEIMPRRLMPKSKAEEFVNLIKNTGLVKEVLIYKQKYSDGKSYLANRFILIININSPEEVIEKIKPICNQMMPYGYDIRIGRFIKLRPTVSDYIRGDYYWIKSSEEVHK
jgi:methyl-coenzyme M reductase subunit D